MLLAIDVGNTNIVLGIFELDQARNTSPLRTWRVTTAHERTADEYGLIFQDMLRHQEIELSDVSEMAIASVVPSLHHVLETCCQRYFDINPLWIEPGLDSGLKITIDNPNELGADRIVNCAGTLEIFGTPVIVVDLGTATTFDVVNEQREYLGGLILPGINIAAEALFQRAARLPRVEIAKPERLVGRNTVQAMQSGLYYGCVDQIDGILGRLTQQFPNATIVATGGLAKTIARESKFIKHVIPDLTLNGLRAIWQRNRGV